MYMWRGVRGSFTNDVITTLQAEEQHLKRMEAEHTLARGRDCDEYSSADNYFNTKTEQTLPFCASGAQKWEENYHRHHGCTKKLTINRDPGMEALHLSHRSKEGMTAVSFDRDVTRALQQSEKGTHSGKG